MTDTRTIAYTRSALNRSDLFYVGQLMGCLISYWPTMTWAWRPLKSGGAIITAGWAEGTPNHAAYPGDLFTVMLTKPHMDIICQFCIETAELKTLGPDEGTMYFDQDGQFIEALDVGGEAMRWLAEITADDGAFVFSAAQRMHAVMWHDVAWREPT